MEFTLGRKVGSVWMTTLSSWNTQSSRDMEKASSSNIRHANVMLTRKTVFKVSSLREHVAMGSKGGFVMAMRTSRRSQEGDLWIGGQPPSRTFAHGDVRLTSLPVGAPGWMLWRRPASQG